MALISLLVFIFYGNGLLGIFLGVSILCTLSISAVIGAGSPLIIYKLSFDSAIASRPFITPLNDIIGLMIYFSFASYLMEFLLKSFRDVDYILYSPLNGILKFMHTYNEGLLRLLETVVPRFHLNIGFYKYMVII